MPINKVPVVHKFGIISQSQRVELEERIARKALLETRRKVESQRSPPRALPFEVTEGFVYKFNDSSLEDKEKLEDIAMKMLKRLRRLAGLREAGEGYHTDLPRAWIDLALLAQCRSPTLEEACLETLLASLDQALILEEHVLSLFYLAKSGIHWLKRDSASQMVLRSGEIKLIQMTRLVFLRLYCHHILGHLKDFEDQQISLSQYLKGFSEKGNCCAQFPGAHLSVRFIIDSGYVICSSSRSVALEELTTYTMKDSFEDDEPGGSENEGHYGEVKNRQKTKEYGLAPDPADVCDYIIRDNLDCSGAGTFNFLWHSLNVWRVANSQKSRLSDALYDLLENASHIAHEPWLNIVMAFYVLADASRYSGHVLEAFQYLISLDLSSVAKPVEPVPLCETCYSSFSNNRGKRSCNSMSFHGESPKAIASNCYDVNSTTDVFQKLQDFVEVGFNECQNIAEKTACCRPSAVFSGNKEANVDLDGQRRLTQEDVRSAKSGRNYGCTGTTRQTEVWTDKTHRPISSEDFVDASNVAKESRVDHVKITGKNSDPGHVHTGESHDPQGSCNHGDTCCHCCGTNCDRYGSLTQEPSTKLRLNFSEAAGSNDGSLDNAGKVVEFDPIREDVNEYQQPKEQPHPTPSLAREQLDTRKTNHCWPWELLYTFCECMTTICLHGGSSNIQKIALLGEEKKHGTRRNGRGGLIDFLEFSKDGTDDFRVRYGVVEGLVRICRHFYGDSTKEGFTDAAWSFLVHCQSTEKDPRVLDAVKVGKIEAELQNKLKKERIPVSLFTSRLAAALSQAFHPKETPVTENLATSQVTNEKSPPKNPSASKSVKTRHESYAKPSLRQEIGLSNACRPPRMSYNTRMNLELRAVIEDQWKKQLHEQMEKEVETNVEQLEKKRNDELSGECKLDKKVEKATEKN